MKDIKRLAAAADIGNHPDGYLVLRVVEHDGGQFDLHAKQSPGALYLPSTEAPAYRLAITADNPETLERLGKALLAIARQDKKDAGDLGDQISGDAQD